MNDDIKKLNLESRDGMQALAKLINIREELVFLADKFKKGGPNVALIRSWRALKKKAGIKDVDEKDFPKTLERPMLVLYSADWCPPCRMMRPTFARLVPFFDKAEVHYTHVEDWKWAKSQGVKGIPQFVAYFPNGARVSSNVGSTTKEIWETMHKLIALGRGWEGAGELVCDGDSCKIISAKKD